MERAKGSWTGPVLVSLAVLAFVAGVGLGLLLGWVVVPVEFVGTEMRDLAAEYKDEFIVLVASAYYADGDMEKAQARLAELDLPNPNQSVASLLDRLSAEGQSQAQLRAMAVLARGMGIAVPDTIAEAAGPAASSGGMPVQPGTNLPAGTLVPGTTSEPSGPRFTIVESRLLDIEENGGCTGNHSVYVEVRDENGSPLSGEVVCRYRSNQSGDAGACQLSGAAGDKPAGWAEFDLGSTSDQVYVASDMSGNDPLSPLSDTLSQADEEIPVSWLIAAGYCESEGDCQAGLANNVLCRGHYSYKVVFQRTR